MKYFVEVVSDTNEITRFPSKSKIDAEILEKLLKDYIVNHEKYHTRIVEEEGEE